MFNIHIEYIVHVSGCRSKRVQRGVSSEVTALQLTTSTSCKISLSIQSHNHTPLYHNTKSLSSLACASESRFFVQMTPVSVHCPSVTHGRLGSASAQPSFLLLWRAGCCFIHHQQQQQSSKAAPPGSAGAAARANQEKLLGPI